MEAWHLLNGFQWERRFQSNYRKHQKVSALVDMIITKSFNGESHQHHSFVDAIRSSSCIQLGRKLGLFVFVGWQRHQTDNNIYSSLTLRSTERSHNNQKWRFFHRRHWGLFEKTAAGCKKTQRERKEFGLCWPIRRRLCPPLSWDMCDGSGRKSPKYRNLKL